MSLYAEYIRERLGDHIIEVDQGFATYRYINGNQCYIVDIYIRTESRKMHLAATLADRIVEIAKTCGCTELIGSVVPSAKGSTESLKVLLGYGMKLASCEDNLIIFKKEI